MSGNTRPFQGQQPPTPETIEALSKLATLFKGLKPDYIPITRSLQMIGIEPITRPVAIDNKEVECLIIPIDELMHKEWKRMTTAPQGEGQDDA